MKNTRKLIALILGAMMLLGMLAGCGKTESKPTENNAPTVSQEPILSGMLVLNANAAFKISYDQNGMVMELEAANEDGDAIVADILEGFADRSAVVVERDRRAAINRAVGGAGPGDIVLVAGKGHEPYQEINGVRHPFDDADVAGAALEGRA